MGHYAPGLLGELAVIWDVIIGFEPAVVIGFVIAGLLLNLTPGADFLYILASGIQGGPRIGMAAAVGVNLGVIIHVLAAAAGLSALLLAYPAAYWAIRYLGAGYLLWMAYQAWRSDGSFGEGRAARGVGNAIRRGFLTNVLNPKTALFILLSFPSSPIPQSDPFGCRSCFLGRYS